MFELKSRAFADGGSIPDRFTREHGNVMPALSWRGAPPETESYALIVEDPDAPKGIVRHLAIADIGAGLHELTEGQDLSGFTVGRNVFGETDWGGPRPPAGDGPHHYHFKLLALDVPELAVESGADAAEVLRATDGHVIAATELIGTYENTAHENTGNEAVRLHSFGGGDVLRLEAVPVPQPANGDAVVRVAAASVNPVDYKIREGKFPPLGADKLPLTLGRDLAGTIEALGPDADPSWHVGDAVFAHIAVDRGAQSQFVLVKADELVAAPASLDPIHAAAVPLAAMTAWQGLFDQGGLSPGQSVLIHGGSGGVGHLAIQFAKAKGARVFTTVGKDELDFARNLGADTVIDYKSERFEDVVHAVDLVLDLVGGETQDRSFAVLRKGGILVSTIAVRDPDQAAAHNVRVAPRWMAQPNAAQLREVADLIDTGKARVIVSKTFPLEQVREAQECQENGHLRGKIVLTVAPRT